MENFKGINFQIFQFHMHPLIEFLHLSEKALVAKIFPFPLSLFAFLLQYKTKAYLTPIPALTMAYCSPGQLKGALGLYFSLPLLISISIFKSRDVLGSG